MLGVGALLLATAFSRAVPWILKLAIDSLREGRSPASLLQLLLWLVLAAAGGATGLYFQRWFLISTSRRIEYDLRSDLFSHLQGLDLGYFAKRRTGDLMAHFTNDLSAVRDVAGPGIMYAGTMTIMLISSVALMITLNPFLTLVAFAPYPLISLVTFFFSRAIHRRARRVQDLFGAISSRVQEDLAGTRVIRTYGQEAACRTRFGRQSEKYLQANMGVAHVRGVFMGAMGALAGSGLAIALYVGGQRVIQGSLSLGSLVAFSAYLADLTWPVIAIGWVIGNLQRGASAAARLEKVLSESPTIRSGTVAAVPAMDIRFRDVSFRYPGADRTALSAINFHLSPGQRLGIVGRTGSGKSTILKLLLRFYEPTSGSIEVGGVDLRSLDLATLRGWIGYAPQDALLFSRTIAENIAYGRSDASRRAVAACAARARLADEIDGFPRGLDTLVGERGITLSGGQRQRASLARALLLDPRVLLLDDTLASVDAETEEEILQELENYLTTRTAIIVTHRISAVRAADWILVLEDGAISEEGTHGTLLARGGLYARMFERQRIAAEIERRG